MTWLEYKAKWPLARIKIKLVQNKMTNRLEKQVGVCNPTFDPGIAPRREASTSEADEWFD
jgi:hypothetical protein